MTTESTQKIKLMKIMEFLRLETDAEHPIPRMELCRRMEEMGIASSLRSIVRDVDVLNEFGYNVKSCQMGHQRGYYVEREGFSASEIKIMMDAIQAAGFISEDKTEELINKLAGLGGGYKTELLKSNLVRFNIRKHSNEAVCDNVEKLEEALRQRRKASFCYFDLNENANRVYRREHERYMSEPIALVYDSGYYYLIGYTTDPAKLDNTVTYRIDRMDDVAVESERICPEAKEKRKYLKGYTSRVFRMFAGHEEKVTLVFDNSLIGAVFDRFGEKIRIKRVDENTCSVTVKVQMSPTFRGWVYQFGDKMKVIQQEPTEKKENT